MWKHDKFEQLLQSESEPSGRSSDRKVMNRRGEKKVGVNAETHYNINQSNNSNTGDDAHYKARERTVSVKNAQRNVGSSNRANSSKGQNSGNYRTSNSGSDRKASSDARQTDEIPAYKAIKSERSRRAFPEHSQAAQPNSNWANVKISNGVSSNDRNTSTNEKVSNHIESFKDVQLMSAVKTEQVKRDVGEKSEKKPFRNQREKSIDINKKTGKREEVLNVSAKKFLPSADAGGRRSKGDKLFPEDRQDFRPNQAGAKSKPQFDSSNRNKRGANAAAKSSRNNVEQYESEEVQLYGQDSDMQQITEAYDGSWSGDRDETAMYGDQSVDITLQMQQMGMATGGDMDMYNGAMIYPDGTYGVYDPSLMYDPSGLPMGMDLSMGMQMPDGTVWYPDPSMHITGGENVGGTIYYPPPPVTQSADMINPYIPKSNASSDNSPRTGRNQ